jgi:hypothetical protein
MRRSTDRETEFAQFLKQATAAPENFIEVWRYGLAMMLINGGRARIVETRPDGACLQITAETLQGDWFTVTRPAISDETEQLLHQRVKEIFEQEIW